MAKVMRGAKDFGLEIGGVEVTRDGTIRVLAEDAIKPSSELDEWLAKGGKGANPT
jgi:acylphosphatase